MITWHWIFFAAIISVGNGSDCPCSKPPNQFPPYTNDKYTAKWWSEIKKEAQSSYNSSLTVETARMTAAVSENGCSIFISCILLENDTITVLKINIILVTSDDQRRNISFNGNDDVALHLECNNDGQYTYKGVPFDAQIGGCMSINYPHP
ncbi:hypothetical protein B9Z55_016615 [Caenorhabditis nigoni]|uniref:C6 domain-containing protein n=1 Tax=Caenorhabditis nigoni TaxID=1611254 RepID=A0A2G5T695_9PELO|nr:hypothetical protein B9Z55_016615 [Caenorhabditis nigoni]